MTCDVLLSHIIFGIQSYFCCVNFGMKCNPLYIYIYTDICYISFVAIYTTYKEIEFRVYFAWTKNISSPDFSKAQIQTTTYTHALISTKSAGFRFQEFLNRTVLSVLSSVLTNKQLSLNSLYTRNNKFICIILYVVQYFCYCTRSIDAES